jgi:hypothetical protein
VVARVGPRLAGRAERRRRGAHVVETDERLRALPRHPIARLVEAHRRHAAEVANESGLAVSIAGARRARFAQLGAASAVRVGRDTAITLRARALRVVPARGAAREPARHPTRRRRSPHHDVVAARRVVCGGAGEDGRGRSPRPVRRKRRYADRDVASDASGHVAVIDLHRDRRARIEATAELRRPRLTRCFARGRRVRATDSATGASESSRTSADGQERPCPMRSRLHGSPLAGSIPRDGARSTPR